jgi:dihydrolipoamide dehydrogenase
MEFAYFYNAFGTEVTVVEMLDRIVPLEDADISKAAERVFKKQGMTIHTSTTVKAIDTNKNGAKVTLVDVNDEKKTQEVQAEKVLVAIGVGARMDGLFADDVKVELKDGHIKTDYRDVAEPTYQTSVPGIYATGDVMAGHHTLGVDYESVPACTYCNPQIASIGLTEQAVKDQGTEYNVGKYQFKAHGKAIATSSTDGLVKLITSKPYGEILGCHIFGENASELIAEISVAKRLEATAEDIISTMHAHPTMHEGMHEAALGTEGRMIHA